MYKAYKFRLYPDENQKTLINKNTRCARLIYNLLLSDRKAYYKMRRDAKEGMISISVLPVLFMQTAPRAA